MDTPDLQIQLKTLPSQPGVINTMIKTIRLYM